MTECNEISEMLVDYVNRRLQKVENIQVINHLAQCKCCRSDAAAYISLKNHALESTTPIPKDMMDSAFNKIHSQEGALNSCKLAYETVKYSMLILKQTITLVRQAI